ncbi:LysR substrate-binding domain-containing protein [Marinobacterium lutimaris]|uniref:Putative choline sulfate-utilization transcription factor n=1 Tax=Marinobacterium lutimaris TaxID=568106 RepID=A0A1H5TYY3_9GAMM|nr:LysR substrate-binding domain-containing protein [Marinobacterium lutimaris]SEF68082.1 putative choline sulfate-utilization transcription factor [Marinobacterium lutimaris]
MLLCDRLPSLQSLLIFESAARHLSFTGAARELGTTQSAVSQQIRALESQLALVLFNRIYRGVELTPDGQELFKAVEQGLQGIAGTLERLQHRRLHQKLNVATDFALASYWLMPKLPEFRQRHPEVDVRILTTQHPFDMDEQDLDVIIGFASQQPGGSATRLFAEEVFPVCHSSLVSDPASVDGTALARLPLLDLHDEMGAGWLSWERFMSHHAVSAAEAVPVLTMDNYILLMQAALAGQGVALGWGTLVDGLIERDLLVALRQFTVTTPGGYFLVEPHPQEAVNAKRHFINWLLETQGDSEAEGLSLEQ